MNKYPTIQQALHYEIMSSRWAGLLPRWANDLQSRYFAAKVNRKYNRLRDAQKRINEIRLRHPSWFVDGRGES